MSGRVVSDIQYDTPTSMILLHLNVHVYRQY